MLEGLVLSSYCFRKKERGGSGGEKKCIAGKRDRNRIHCTREGSWSKYYSSGEASRSTMLNFSVHCTIDIPGVYYLRSSTAVLLEITGRCSAFSIFVQMQLF
jgi:hypothetical protein